MAPDEIINLGALHKRRAPVLHRRQRVSGAGPWSRQMRRQILEIRAHLECRRRIGPDLPRGARLPKPAEEPRLLLGTEDGLGRPVSGEVVDLDVADAERGGWMAVAVRPSRIEYLERLLWQELGEVIAREFLAQGVP